MGSFLSSYNYDFAIATVPVQFILLIIFCLRRNLPSRSTHWFLAVMATNLVMTLTDIYSCEVDELWQAYPLPFVYGINIAYFLAFICRGWFLFIYAINECRGYFGARWSWTPFHVPAILTLVVIATTPWTHALFVVDPQTGYANQWMYPIIYYCTYFYIAASLVCVLACRKDIPPYLQATLTSCNIVLILSNILRRQFDHVLVTSYFSLLAILIIYLSVQNPGLFRDSVTHLFNPTAFARIVGELLGLGRPFHCVALSVDNYESLKALYEAHQLGQALERFGTWLIGAYPRYYLFYSGDGHFLMLSKRSFDGEQGQTASQLWESIRHPWVDSATGVALSTSALVLPYELLPDNLPAIQELTSFAFDTAYAENTRDKLVMGSGMLDVLSRHAQVEAALGRALARQGIEVHLQPIYSVEEGRVVSAEALARLHDPELGYIPPSEFIQVAEQTGDIVELGNQILTRVCEIISQGELERRGISSINVNLSPAQCMDDRLAEEIGATLARYDVPMRMFEFEITESSIEDHSLVQRQMERLHEMGATFSLDDFGTGASNLTRLIEMPIHIVKLDMTVVRSYFEGQLPILPDMVRMFHNAQMRVVVEGVETREMRDVLETMGCDFEQGYYFSRPLPYDQFVAYLQKQDSEAGVR